MKTKTRILTVLALGATMAFGAPSAEAAPKRVCFPSTAEQRLTATIPVVPGYCLVRHRVHKPEPGTINRGTVEYKGRMAVVRIYRAGSWHTYLYVRCFLYADRTY